MQTPDAEFDALFNRWSLYQALACRMWARSALYQSSGAYGFRDQLQDCMAFVYAEPEIARAHLLRAASRQFIEGDVQHWWHEPSGRGVRTRFSDDLVWLPFVADHYVRVTGDAAIWDAAAPYLAMRSLAAERAGDLRPAGSERRERHAVRALCPRLGPCVHHRRAWSAADRLRRLERRHEPRRRCMAKARACGSRGSSRQRFGNSPCMPKRAATRTPQPTIARRASAYAAAVEQTAWDGEWYRRAYFDDGSPLGTAADDECRIDAIAQSWAVLSGAGDPRRARAAMQAVNEQLVREDARLILLLTPPFDRRQRDPGYIKGYLPGVRENGAQYTHAALWTVLAIAQLGDGDRAGELMRMLNPLTHARNRADADAYMVEPYVRRRRRLHRAGPRGSRRVDVVHRFGELELPRRAGGDARLREARRHACASIRAFRRRGRVLRSSTATARACTRSTSRIPRRVSKGVASLTVDGVAATDSCIHLLDDGARHAVTIVLGPVTHPTEAND